jgi:osmotically-inducible protein OsmY
MLGALMCGAAPVKGDNVRGLVETTLEPILVTAKRRVVAVPDEVLKKQVEAALHDDPVFPDMHVDVRVKNGVAYLEGVVFDDSDATDAKRIARRIPGVRRVVCDFYIPDGQ